MASDETAKAKLIADLDRARADLRSARRGSAAPTDAKPGGSSLLVQYRVPLLIGGAILGLIIARSLTKPKTPPKVKVNLRRSDGEKTAEKTGKAGLMLLAAKFLFDLARPALTRLAMRQVNDYLAHRRSASHPRRV